MGARFRRCSSAATTAMSCIHGSPTCELVYKNAKAELCGDRKLGLIKYVMALMNGARLGIAAQSVGLSQAAYNEGLAYAKERKQFGKAIIDFPAVYDMLSIMKAGDFTGVGVLHCIQHRFANNLQQMHLHLRIQRQGWQTAVEGQFGAGLIL